MDSATRKKLKREYKEAAPPAGVYSIVNTANGRRFIGASVNVPAILNRNRGELAFGNHRFTRLQDDWNEYGEDAFTFETLELLDDDYDSADAMASDLAALEKLYLDKYQPYDDNGYNKR